MQATLISRARTAETVKTNSTIETNISKLQETYIRRPINKNPVSINTHFEDSSIQYCHRLSELH